MTPPQYPIPNTFLARLRRAISAFRSAPLASVSAQVDDSSGWLGFTGGPNDRDAGEIQEQYTDALEAWRKNPFAKRIVDTTTDYCLGDGMIPSAAGRMGEFLDRWWSHPKNSMDRRMPDLSDELARAGDLFLTLHRNPEDGISYVRPIPKDRILAIVTLDNDWETEIAYQEATDLGAPRLWLSPAHADAPGADAVMVHYSVNRVVGALMGESDLGAIIPWLLRYSRMIEDRVRLHWATKAFLWIVTVPTNLVRSKMEQYREPPETGSVLVKDAAETWEAQAPDLKAFDAQFDLRAVRQMIDAGAGMPPHWRGEAHDVSLATAKAMENAASRHLRRRQLYLRYIVQDLAHLAYTRAWQTGRARGGAPDRAKITVTLTDLDREDNQELAVAAKDVAQAMSTLVNNLLPGKSPTLQRWILRLITRFAGEGLGEQTIEQIFTEMEANPNTEEDQDHDTAE